MKEVIALLVFVIISGLTIFHALKRRIGNSLTAILLVFSLASGWTIANHDWLREVKWEVPGIPAFQKQVNSIKEDALEEMRKEVENHKRSLDQMASTASDAGEKTDARKKAAESLLEALKRAEESVKGQEEKLRELIEKAGQTKDQIAAMQRATSELSLLLTRIAWLQVEARDETDATRLDAVNQQIMDQLDEVVKVVITDPDARSKFVSDVMSSLPPRQQQ